MINIKLLKNVIAMDRLHIVFLDVMVVGNASGCYCGQ